MLVFHRWPGENALHRLQELGKPGAQDEVVIAALRAAQAVLVRGEEKGRESCLDWIRQCAREGEEEVGNWAYFTFLIVNFNSKIKNHTGHKRLCKQNLASGYEGRGFSLS